ITVRGVACFFSSRRRHTRFSRDWSSDVCSSDLVVLQERIRFAAVLPNQHFDRLHNEVRLGCQFWNTLYRFASWETKPVHELVIQIGRASCREEWRARVSADQDKEKRQAARRRTD